MAQIKKITLLILTSFLFLISACSKKAKQPATQRTQPQWAASFDSLSNQYQAIHRVYMQDSTQFSPQAQQMYHDMQSLWSQMNMARSGMMQQGGMMNGRGKMGRQGMMGGNRMGRGMMGRGMMNGYSMMRFREMNQQMLSYCQGMQQLMNQANNQNMSSMYGQMINHMQQMMSLLPVDTTSTPAPQKTASTTPDGASLFADNCSSCHGTKGQGFTSAFPPLNGSSVVSGNVETLTKVVLNGLQGPVTVKGNRYNGIMPAFGSTLNDDQLAAVLSYIRSMPDNKARQVTTNEITDVRKKTASHKLPWTASELGLK